jgi:hypothetical protein
MCELNQKMYINTAFSSHKQCFICRTKIGPLHRINKESIAYSLSKHRILIPESTRSCRKHLDPENRVFHLEFLNENIPSRPIAYDSKIVKALNSIVFLTEKCNLRMEKILTNQYHGPFEAFRNTDTLEDQHCIDITGWNKQEFLNILKYIKKIRNTKHRTKSQLVALYKYWLRKGVDQQTLAFFKGCEQRQISSELATIRNSIYKYFTPHYIGFKNKTRDFFIKHNTPTVKKLYDIGDNCLIIICDGGYQRIQKSVNNEFQSGTFSGQMGENLLKPFLIVTTDGYICDVYCDNEAWKNDEKILRETLENDPYLRNILEPNDMIFLDRGLKITDLIQIIFEH